MKITVKWDNPDKTTLQWVLHSGWDWTEFFEVTRRIDSLLSMSNHKADFLINLWDSPSLPQDTIPQFSKIRQASHLSHPNAGVIIIFGASKLAQSIGNLFKATYSAAREKIFFVEDEQSATILLNELRKDRETQPNLFA